MTIIRYWNLKETIIWSYLVSRTLQEEKNSSDDTSDNSDCKLAESLWNGFKNELNLTQCKNIISIFTVLIACVTVGIFMLMFGFLYYYYYTPPRDLWLWLLSMHFPKSELVKTIGLQWKIMYTMMMKKCLYGYYNYWHKHKNTPNKSDIFHFALLIYLYKIRIYPYMSVWKNVESYICGLA